MIHVLAAKVEMQLADDIYRKYLDFLPPSLKERNLKFVRWEDRQTNLFGKILLMEGLQQLGFERSVLDDLRYNSYGRPFLNAHIDFNISHSGYYVLCAISSGQRVGVDVEMLRPVNLTYFESVMTAAEWALIKNSGNDTQLFFKYWTIKESVVKADGRGLNIPLQHIAVHNNEVCYDGVTWYLSELDLGPGYCGHVVTDRPADNITFHLKSYA
ncbi:4'-phosphopantetheinyl transferase superfamily protein [Chitinophaga sancti]|uniref:4'-phosphopantetheinyl transferase family protein n=1 Tax=Chitinophaga sancti TaxID=1004 RepID=UPI002A75545E|nr:4'-phosphopantetheinyl transferase superfamily protein [Chitinophaga sancti]WPQ61775.1 4'-phosphopantetheinyl transferase superfamily protein [Chitinophaga sancti]